jgi:hypothetical protein
MEHHKESRPLKPDEFDQMMQEFDVAQAWMLKQLKSRRQEDQDSPTTAAKDPDE